MEKKRENKKKTYWYKFDYWECVLCGRTTEYKTRVYNEPKPKEYWKRHVRHEEACGEHFV